MLIITNEFECESSLIPIKTYHNKNTIFHSIVYLFKSTKQKCFYYPYRFDDHKTDKTKATLTLIEKHR